VCALECGSSHRTSDHAQRAGRGEPLMFEQSSPGRRAIRYPKATRGPQPEQVIPSALRRRLPPRLPEVSELDVVRHFTRLSQLNFSVDTHMYPLGSCTMKYNPKVNDALAALEGFAQLHPYQPVEQCQGILRLLKQLEALLCEICGMAAFSLQPAAGAQGELVGLAMVRAYHTAHGAPRRFVLIPDSAHGTNPASAALCGYTVQTISSGADGLIDLAQLRQALSGEVAALMLTNPNTLGLFERQILDVTRLVHEAGALVYLDGANLNALLGLVQPGAMGVDVLHLNLHKTFSTPHGGGGPGAGPVGVTRALEPYLPVPRLVEQQGTLQWSTASPHAIGRVRSFYGNVGILIRAYAYLLAYGTAGLADISRGAILTANYLAARLAAQYDLPYGRRCMHEFIISAKRQKASGGSALDIAKRLLDYGCYAPTIYFPLIVEEALMIEPTETESLQTLEQFAEAMLAIAAEVEHEPARLKHAPTSTPVTRLDEVTAARQPDVRYQPPQDPVTQDATYAMRHV